MDDDDQPKRPRFFVEAEPSVDQQAYSLYLSTFLRLWLLLSQNGQQPTEQYAPNCSVPVEQTRKRRRLCNELIFEMCHAMHLSKLETAKNAMLAAVNIRTYLEPKFHKRKQVIYRDAIAFLRTNLAADRTGKEINIRIYQLKRWNEKEHYKIKQCRSASANQFRLDTNQVQLGITIKNNNSNNPCDGNVQCCIYDAETGNVHLHYLVRLIAALVQPTKLNATLSWRINSASLARFLDSMGSCIDCVQLDADRLLSRPLCAALVQCDKLHIEYCDCQHSSRTHKRRRHGHASCLAHDDRLQFRRAFIQWLTAANEDGREKKCNFVTRKMVDDQELAALLDEIKTEFSCATSKRPYAVRFALMRPPDAEPSIGEFRVPNECGEVLQLSGPSHSDGFHYTLTRRPIGESGSQNVVAEFAGMTSIILE